MPQLAKMTTYKAVDLNFKCPYHAKVMKTFDRINKNTGMIACMKKPPDKKDEKVYAETEKRVNEKWHVFCLEK